MSKYRCKECKQVLEDDQWKCSCGWKSNVKTERDHGCEYRYEGRRCPLPGTICPYPYAISPWFCFLHAKNESNHEKDFPEIEKNFLRILEERKDWRKKLF